jgi:hypothetical protein
MSVACAAISRVRPGAAAAAAAEAERTVEALARLREVATLTEAALRNRASSARDPRWSVQRAETT